MTPELLDRYIRLLDIPRRSPCREALFEIVRAHMTRIPFENLSKLYYLNRYNLRGLPDLERYLDGVERRNFGGTCYTNNTSLHLLLGTLGYDAMLCGADMSEPDVHLVNVVRVDGREFLVDTGYAAPFVEPLPLDLSKDIEVSLGSDRYVLHPKDPTSGYSRMDLFRNGELIHGYTAKPIHRPIEYFTPVFEQSFRPEATFLNSLLMVRMYENRSVVISNLTVIESEGAKSRTTRLGGPDQFPAAIKKHFSISEDITAQALEELADFGEAWD